jgi:hypothetical protein
MLQKYRKKRRVIEQKSRQRRFQALDSLRMVVQQDKLPSAPEAALVTGIRKDYQADICNEAVGIIL